MNRMNNKHDLLDMPSSGSALIKYLLNECMEYFPAYNDVCYTHENKYKKEIPSCIKGKGGMIENVEIKEGMDNINLCLALIARYYDEPRMTLQARIQSEDCIRISAYAEDKEKGFSAVTYGAEKVTACTQSEYEVSVELTVIQSLLASLMTCDADGTCGIGYNKDRQYRNQIRFLRVMEMTLETEILKYEALGK